MITSKQIRKVFQPLSLITHVEVKSGNPVQIFDSMLSTYTPDYRTQNLVLRPVVNANTSMSDSSWTNGIVNNKLDLSSIKWMINGKTLAQMGWTENTDYIIDKSSTGNTRGTLTIKRNIPSATYYDFQMEAKFTDTRTNKIITVQTDPVNVACTEIGVDELDLTVVADPVISYDPLLDRLKEYDWKVAHGKITASTTERNKCFDGNQYLRRMPIVISHGSYCLKAGDARLDAVDVKVYCPVTSADKKTVSYLEITAEDNIFLVELAKDHLTVDCRFIPDGTPIEVRLYKGQTERARYTMTYALRIPDYVCEPTNESMFELYKSGYPETYYRHDEARLTCYGRIYEYPEAFLDITWKTYTYKTPTSETEVTHGTGATVEIDMNKAAIIGVGENCYLRTCIDHHVKIYTALITLDNEGNIIVVNSKGTKLTSDALIG